MTVVSKIIVFLKKKLFADLPPPPTFCTYLRYSEILDATKFSGIKLTLAALYLTYLCY